MQNNDLSIFLYGAWKNNLGDDLFLKVITQRYPNYTFHVLVNKKYINVYSDINNLVVHTKNGRFTRMMNALFRLLNMPDYIFLKMSKIASVVILLGGSLYQQESNWKKLYSGRLKMIGLFKASFAIGNNFGPSSDPEFLNCYKIFFRKLTDVCFRDRQSQMLFPYDNVRTASDIVFGIDSYYTSKVAQIIDVLAEKPYAVVSVIDLFYKSVSRNYQKVTADIYESWISDLILQLEHRGYHVILMGFCTAEGDDIAIDRIIGKNSFNNTIKIIHRNIDESLLVLKEADLVVATRFHAMILGWTFGKKVVPIVYGNKMKQVIHDTSFDGCCVNIEEIDQYDPSYVIDHAKKLRDISSFADDSENQFYGFDQWLACN